MLILAATTDKIQIVTSAAVTVDVHASFVDNASGAITAGKQNTAISTATTTDVVSAPGASTVRNIKTLTARNKGGSSVDVTVLFDQNGTDFELIKTTLLPGETLQYFEEIGFQKTASTTASMLTNCNTSDVTASGVDTYLTGSSVNLAGKLQAGSVINWYLKMSKTAAGTGAPLLNIRVGTAGTTADTARANMTGVAQTAALDNGAWEVECLIRSIGASGVIAVDGRLSHNGTTAGIANQAQEQFFQSTPAGFDMTGSPLIFGLSCNPNTSAVWTFQGVSVIALGLK